MKSLRKDVILDYD
jgi:serum/glucocorticoid-regulated kinase 2